MRDITQLQASDLPGPEKPDVIVPRTAYPRRDRFYLTAGDARTTKSYTVAAQVLRVNNWTDQWVHIHGLDEYVPPQTAGVVFYLGGSYTVSVEYSAPPGVTQPASTAGQQTQFDVG